MSIAVLENFECRRREIDRSLTAGARGDIGGAKSGAHCYAWRGTDPGKWLAVNRGLEDSVPPAM